MERQGRFAIIRVLVDENACESDAGACDWFSGLLSEHEDVIDWGYVHDEDGHATRPELVDVPKDYIEGDLYSL